jgi:transcriptional repressor NrdR
MKCFYCGYPEQKVLDTRPARDGEAIRRRRECLKCGRRFTTFEAPETHPLYVIKSDGTRQELNKEKILRGMVIACRKRPIPIEILRATVDSIETQLLQDFDTEISSEEVGNRVLEALKNIDAVAYIRFASVYMHFQSPQEFLEIIYKLDQPKKARGDLVPSSVVENNLTTHPSTTH